MVFLELFVISLQKDQKHLAMAHLFDKPCFLGPLSLQVRTLGFILIFEISYLSNSLVMLTFTFQDDDIAGLHVNTHVPVLIGAQKRYEVVGDHLYKVNWKLKYGVLVNKDHYCNGHNIIRFNLYFSTVMSG